MHPTHDTAAQFATNGAALAGLPAADASLGAGDSTPAPLSRRHRQRLDHYEYVVGLRQFLTGLQTADNALASRLEEHHVTAALVAACLGKLEVAEQKIEVRQQAIAIEEAAVTAQHQAYESARRSLAAFRAVARTALTESAAQTTLRLNEPMPNSIDLFVDMAQRTLATAQQEPYTTLLAATTLPAERAAALHAQVELLADAVTARKMAHRAALDACQMRDAAVQSLRHTVRPLKVEVALILKEHPEIGRPVGF